MQLHECENNGHDRNCSGEVKEYKNPYGKFILCESCADIPIEDLLKMLQDKNR
jgi:hypothetical protein